MVFLKKGETRDDCSKRTESTVLVGLARDVSNACSDVLQLSERGCSTAL